MYAYIYLNEWSSNRVLIRLGLNYLIGWLQLVQSISYMYVVCMYDEPWSFNCIQHGQLRQWGNTTPSHLLYTNPIL